MFGIGAGEFVLIMIVGLIVFGPSKLPEIGRSVGKLLREFRKAQATLSATLAEPDEPPKKSQPFGQAANTQSTTNPSASQSTTTQAMTNPSASQAATNQSMVSQATVNPSTVNQTAANRSTSAERPTLDGKFETSTKSQAIAKTPTNDEKIAVEEKSAVVKTPSIEEVTEMITSNPISVAQSKVNLSKEVGDK